MDDYSGQNPAPGTPPPPSYPQQPPAPAYQQPPAPVPAAPPAAGYAPAPAGYAPASAAPPKKKKTWLWIILAIVGLGLLGCIGLTIAGVSLFSVAAEPGESIDAINQAALDGDAATFEKYFDSESVSRSAYSDFIDYVKSTPDYESLVTELGEEEADRMLREDILPEDAFVDEMMGEFSVDSLEEGQVPFPDYTLTSSSIENSTAEITIVTIEEGEEVTYVLGMVKETVGDEDVWRVTEIKNIADMLEEDL